LDHARRFLIPFPAVAEGPANLEDTVFSIPCPEKVFQPARRKVLPKSVSMVSCAAGIALAFLAGAATGKLAAPQTSAFAAAQAQPVAQALESPAQPLLAAVLSSSAAVATPRSRRIRFTLNESGKFQRVGPLELRLKKADEKKQTFTLTLQMKNKRVELQGRALAEPIRLHPSGARESEILIQRIEGSQVEGYLRVQAQ